MIEILGLTSVMLLLQFCRSKNDSTSTWAFATYAFAILGALFEFNIPISSLFFLIYFVLRYAEALTKIDENSDDFWWRYLRFVEPLLVVSVVAAPQHHAEWFSVALLLVSIVSLVSATAYIGFAAIISYVAIQAQMPWVALIFIPGLIGRNLSLRTVQLGIVVVAFLYLNETNIEVEKWSGILLGLLSGRLVGMRELKIDFKNKCDIAASVAMVILLVGLTIVKAPVVEIGTQGLFSGLMVLGFALGELIQRRWLVNKKIGQLWHLKGFKRIFENPKTFGHIYSELFWGEKNLAQLKTIEIRELGGVSFSHYWLIFIASCLVGVWIWL